MNSQNWVSQVLEKSTWKKWFDRVKTWVYAIIWAWIIIPEIEHQFPKSVEVEIVWFKKLTDETIIWEDKTPIVDYSIDISPTNENSFWVVRGLSPKDEARNVQGLYWTTYAVKLEILGLVDHCKDWKVIATIDVNPLIWDRARDIKNIRCSKKGVE